MAKWQKDDATGISVGGEYYQADDFGVVDVPDNIGGLEEYGFKRYVNKSERDQNQRLAEEEAAKIKEAEKAAKTNAEKAPK